MRSPPKKKKNSTSSFKKFFPKQKQLQFTANVNTKSNPLNKGMTNPTIWLIAIYTPFASSLKKGVKITIAMPPIEL